MKNFLAGVIVCILFSSAAIGQELFELDQSKLDTTRRNIKRIVNLSEYYLEQLKKDHLSQGEFDDAKSYLFKAEQELKLIDKARINNAKYKLDKAFIIEAKKERDARLNELATSPLNYFSAEENSFHIGAFVGITGGKYSQPAALLGEYNFTKNWSAGAWVGYFMEQQQVISSYDSKPSYYSVGEMNYKFNYLTVGLQGKYRFFNPAHPLFGLPIKRFHFFVSAAIGLNKVLNRVALQNDSYLQNNPSKQGLAYGFWPGIHCQLDNNLGLDLEAGYGTIGYLKIGVNWRFFKYRKKLPTPTTRNTSFIK